MSLSFEKIIASFDQIPTDLIQTYFVVLGDFFSNMFIL